MRRFTLSFTLSRTVYSIILFKNVWREERKMTPCTWSELYQKAGAVGDGLLGVIMLAVNNPLVMGSFFKLY